MLATIVLLGKIDSLFEVNSRFLHITVNAPLNGHWLCPASSLLPVFICWRNNLILCKPSEFWLFLQIETTLLFQPCKLQNTRELAFTRISSIWILPSHECSFLSCVNPCKYDNPVLCIYWSPRIFSVFSEIETGWLVKSCKPARIPARLSLCRQQMDFSHRIHKVFKDCPNLQV